LVCAEPPPLYPGRLDAPAVPDLPDHRIDAITEP
jgi:hypothetical protein